ncbi:MAG: Crp/Fnr family transcriptional regulator [Vulcanimicrobiaceae bacterium]
MRPGDEKASGAADFLAVIGTDHTVRSYGKGSNVFSQGDLADAIFYLQRGQVNLVIVSSGGKEAIIATIEPGMFFGEGCIAGQTHRITSAAALTDSSALSIEKRTMMRLLHDQPEVSDLFITHLLTRNIRVQEDLVDQLFNSSEKRLARTLLLLAHIGKDGRPEPIVPKITQEALAEMIGTTRSRVSFFLQKFEKLGFIDHEDGLRVHTSLLNVILSEHY